MYCFYQSNHWEKTINATTLDRESVYPLTQKKIFPTNLQAEIFCKRLFKGKFSSDWMANTRRGKIHILCILLYFFLFSLFFPSFFFFGTTNQFTKWNFCCSIYIEWTREVFTNGINSRANKIRRTERAHISKRRETVLFFDTIPPSLVSKVW